MKLNSQIKNLTDEELVNQIVSSDNVLLFDELYERYAKKIYNKCISFSKNTQEAEDLTHDIFIKLFAKLKTFKGNSKFSSWLYAFTYNFCVNYITRSTAKKIEKKSVDKTEQIEEGFYDSDFSVFQLKVTKLKKALALIPLNDRMILLMKYQDDMSIKEIANTLNLRESAVKMRIKRAKEKLIHSYNLKLTNG